MAMSRSDLEISGGVRLDLSGLRSDPPFVVCDVHDPIRVEDALSLFGFTVGDNWTFSSPEQEQDDGRWKLFVEPIIRRFGRRSGI